MDSLHPSGRKHMGKAVKNSEKKSSRGALRRAEEVANTAPVMIWMSDVDKLCTYVNQRWLEFTGRALAEGLGNGWAEAVHPEDLQGCLELYTKAFDRREPFQMEYRLRRHDGEYSWILDQAVPRFSVDGSFDGYIGSGIDVTEFRLAKEALQKSDERLRLAMEAGKSVGWDWDIRSGRDFLFGDLQSIFGIPAEGYDGRVEDFHRYLHPEDRRRVLKAVKYAMQTHKPYAAEFRLRWPDGTVRWVTAKGKFYYSKAGDPERMLGVAICITDRKLADEALRESEERLRLAAQTGKMYTFDWDVATDVVIRSAESTRIFGLTGEETKRELLAHVHPEDRAGVITSLAECTPESPNTQITYRLLRPDGSVVWLERNGHGFFDEQGKMVRMIGMVADITQHKLAEEKLKEYERAVEGAGEMIVVVDREYRCRIANNEFVKMHNITKEQVVGRFVDEILKHDGLSESVVKKKLDECFLGEVVKCEMKYTYPRLGERDIFVSCFPIEGATSIDRIACIVRDVTEQKLAEEALSTVSQKRQKLIEAHEEERTRIARELRDDINQRLAALAVQIDGLRTVEVRKRIRGLASDIQALSHRLHSPKLEYLGLEVAAASFCGELSDRQRVQIAFQSENIPKKLPQDASLTLFRVLQEAAQNAIKHSGSRHFEVSLKGRTGEIELTVHDSGSGFEPREAIKGCGLGLTSMQERLKVVDGQLFIDSKPGSGTTIRARVPFRSDPNSAGTAVKSQPI